MVSGSKKDKIPKKKGKMALAKDPKQLAIAIAVILLFLGNTIFMVVKYVQEQNPPPLTAAQKANLPKTPEEMMKEGPNQNPDANPVGQTQAGAQPANQPQGDNASNKSSQPSQDAQAAQNTQAPPASPEGLNPAIPVGVILLLLALAYGISQYLKKNGSGANSFKKSGTPIKGKGGKEKFTLAKDPKQAAIALAVILLFIGNSIYMVVKYVQEQNPPPVTQSANGPKNMDEMMKMKTGQNPDGTPANPSSPDAQGQNAQPGAQSTQNPQAVQNVQVAPPAAGINPAIPIGIIIVLLALAYGISQYLKNNASGSNAFKKEGMSAKGKKGKDKFALAADPKQAAIALVVLILFLGNTIYMIVKYVQEQNPQPVAAQNPQNMTPAERMAQMQQKNLESLSGGKGGVTPNPNVAQDANDIYSQTVSMQGDGHVTNNGEKGISRDAQSDVEILPKKMARDANGKMVMITVDNSGRSNPFLPASENFVPSANSSMPFLPPPPETLQADSDAGKVMTTTISGILYDKYSPSAIINIEGVDYLVKKGDVVNRYKILSVAKSQVLVQLGKNVYQAGVGELLSLTNLNFNTIANLNKKFGGNDVSINVKKKGY